MAAGGARLALSTDTYVVRPRFFPGGNIGDLAVNGTVNDLAMCGAVPLFLTVGFILEEGLPMDELGRVVDTMAAAARAAGVEIVTGDTKVVDAGHGDGLYVTTAGVGLVPDGVRVGPDQARPGDVVLVSGPIGLHGIAVMSVREGLEFGSDIRSDTAPLNGVVQALLGAGVEVHALRDPTRGGLAATLHEIAGSSGVGVEIREADVPVPDDVRAACGFLGLDPLYVANEGRLVAFVAPEDADRALEILRRRPGLGRRRRDRRGRRRPPRDRGGGHADRRHPGGRPAPRRAAAPHLLTGPFTERPGQAFTQALAELLTEAVARALAGARACGASGAAAGAIPRRRIHLLPSMASGSSRASPMAASHCGPVSEPASAGPPAAWGARSRGRSSATGTSEIASGLQDRRGQPAGGVAPVGQAR